MRHKNETMSLFLQFIFQSIQAYKERTRTSLKYRSNIRILNVQKPFLFLISAFSFSFLQVEQFDSLIRRNKAESNLFIFIPKRIHELDTNFFDLRFQIKRNKIKIGMMKRQEMSSK